MSELINKRHDSKRHNFNDLDLTKKIVFFRKSKKVKETLNPTSTFLNFFNKAKEEVDEIIPAIIKPKNDPFQNTINSNTPYISSRNIKDPSPSPMSIPDFDNDNTLTPIAILPKKKKVVHQNVFYNFKRNRESILFEEMQVNREAGELKRGFKFIPNEIKSLDHTNNKASVKRFSLIPIRFNSMIAEKIEEDKKVERSVNAVYNKVFDKNLNSILEIKRQKSYSNLIKRKNIDEERYKFSLKSHVNKKISDIKERVHFMKGIIDYVYPKLMIDKVRIYKEEYCGNNMLKSKSESNIFNKNNKSINSISSDLLQNQNQNQNNSSSQTNRSGFCNFVSQSKKMKSTTRFQINAFSNGSYNVSTTNRPIKPKKLERVFAPIDIKSVSGFI